MRRRDLWIAFLATAGCAAGADGGTAVHFDHKLQDWDGFGVNYVQVAQTRDYEKDPQEYGGFSTLSEAKRGEILDLIFGADGLKPALLKMFLDPYQEGRAAADRGRFDHRTTTQWMRYFAREGLRRNRARGADLAIITTLYGPPGWMTKQDFVRGRDVDPARKRDLAEYMIDWVRYLRGEEKLPVRYISLHNEGEDYGRWPLDGSSAGLPQHDFNLFWPDTQVADFLRFLRPMMDRAGLGDVGLSPGETSTWARFAHWGYAWAIYNDAEAMRNIGLITSHGFGDLRENSGLGVALLRTRRPDLHAWTTSMSWGRMDVSFLELIRQQIYAVKVNGVIPWAAVQTDTWTGGDPNPGTAIRVDRKGGYAVEPGYYWYKQVSRVGQPGMAVAEVASASPDIRMMAFAGNGSGNPDALVILNLAPAGRKLAIEVTGTGSRTFEARATGNGRFYQAAGAYTLRNGVLECEIGGNSAITLAGSK